MMIDHWSRRARSSLIPGLQGRWEWMRPAVDAWRSTTA